MSASAPERNGPLVALAILGVASFLLMLVGMAEIGRRGGIRISPLAIGSLGYADAVAVAEGLGYAVGIHRSEDPRGLERADLIVLTEPTELTSAEIRDRIAGNCPVLVVLPKWNVVDPGFSTREPYAELRDDDEAQRILTAAAARRDGSATGARLATEWHKVGAAPAPLEPSLRTHRRLDPPELDRPQLVAGGTGLNRLDGRPLRTSPLAVGVTREGTFVVSDPDLLNNHGIRKGDNALHWTALLRHILPRGGTIVFDATGNGISRPAGILAALIDPPLLSLTLQLLLLTAAAVWAAGARFGSPLPEEDALPPGSALLIEDVARLRDGTGRHAGAILHYFAAAQRQVVRAYRLEALDDAERDRALERISRARASDDTPPYPEIAAAVQRCITGARTAPKDTRRTVAVAGIVDRWRKEMLDGRG